MDRCGIFVDAGYLIAEGAKSYVASAAKRGDVEVIYPTLVEPSTASPRLMSKRSAHCRTSNCVSAGFLEDGRMVWTLWCTATSVCWRGSGP